MKKNIARKYGKWCCIPYRYPSYQGLDVQRSIVYLFSNLNARRELEKLLETIEGAAQRATENCAESYRHSKLR